LSKSKFVHFAPAFTSEGGGIFEVVNCLAYEQCKVHGASNVIVLGCSDKALAKVHSMPNDVVLDILPYKYSYVKFIQGFLKFKKILKDCDVLHVHGAWSLQFLYLIPFIVFNENCRLIYQPHGLLSSVRYKKNRFVKLLSWHLFMKFIVRRSSVVVSTSSIEEEEFIFSDEISKKVICVPNAIATDFFDEPLKTRTDNNFLFLSQIIPIKGIDLLLRAFARIIGEHHKVTLTIGGYGDPTYLQQLHKLVEELNLYQYVNFIGPVARDDRIRIYDAHKFFILPSKNESFGLVVGEALARGCISFISERTPWAKVSDVPNLITIRPEQKDIYDNIKSQLITNKQYLEKDAITSQDIIKKKYAWAEKLEQFNILYAGP
jgi:glycosyltransferase involved in cell wall biosynthesis